MLALQVPLLDSLPELRHTQIIYTPDTPDARGVAAQLDAWVRAAGGGPGLAARPQGFATEAALEAGNRALALQRQAIFNASASWARVVGVSFGSLEPGSVSYTIRLQSDDAASFARWSSPAQAVLGEQSNGTIERSALLRSGFVLLEHALNEAVKSWHAEPDGSQPPAAQVLRRSTIDVERFPQREWESRYGGAASGSPLSLGLLVRIYLPMAFMTSVSLLIVGIVDEKEKKLKEGMKMMGLSDFAYWMSWVASHGAMMFAVALLAAVIIHVFGLFPRTGVVWIFGLLLSYNLALVPPCMLVSLLFNKVKSASNAAGATAPKTSWPSTPI